MTPVGDPGGASGGAADGASDGASGGASGGGGGGGGGAAAASVEPGADTLASLSAQHSADVQAVGLAAVLLLPREEQIRELVHWRDVRGDSLSEPDRLTLNNVIARLQSNVQLR